MNSSRLRGKAMMDLCGKTVLERVLLRTKASKVINDIWLATSHESHDDIIELVGKKNQVKVFRGSLCDVLDRFCNVVRESKADIVIRVTADNPFTDPRLIDLGVNRLISDGLDYLAFKNIPVGSGAEVVRREALLYSGRHAKDKDDREHVTMFIKKHPDLFKVELADSPIKTLNRPDMSVTIDTMDQYLRLYRALDHVLKTGKSEDRLENLICVLSQIK